MKKTWKEKIEPFALKEKKLSQKEKAFHISFSKKEKASWYITLKKEKA